MWQHQESLSMANAFSSGTGIFLQPPAVLLLTRNKGEALGLWALGFAYTIVRYTHFIREVCKFAKICLSMLLYLEFARKLPHSGGELVYVSQAR